MKTYRYQTPNDTLLEVSLTDEQTAIVIQAESDYITARDYILAECYYIWRHAYKTYHLSTKDRESRMNKQPWRSNIPFWYIRSFIDVFTSTLSERPLIYTATALDEKWLDNKQDIIDFLSTISDMNGFNRESKKILAEGLKTGTFAVRVNYRPPVTPIYYTYLYNNTPIEDSYTPEIGDIPYAEHVDVFKLFPDPGTGNLSFVTERDVVTIDAALRIFSGLINNASNTSPFKDTDLVKHLTLNLNGADLDDYGSVRNEVHAEVNSKMRSEDTTAINTNTTATASTTSTSSSTADRDSRLNANRIEYKYYVTNSRIILFFNNYPVYIWPNIYGFIPYVIKPTSNADIRLGVEWIPYLLRGVEKGINGYMNFYLDNVNFISQPNYVATKGAVFDESAFNALQPGEVIYVDGNPDAIKRLDKGTVNDFNVMEIFGRTAQQLTGASEYNLWVSARERTATGANATSQSSQKRLSPFIESFMVVMSEVAKMQLKMAVKFWIKPKNLIINEKTAQTIKKFQANKLNGLVNITLEMDSMFAAQNELQNKRLLELLNMVKGSGLAKEDELMRQIIQNMGLSPTKIVPEAAPEITEQSDMPTDIPELPEEPTPNNAELPAELRAAITPQLNLQ